MYLYRNHEDIFSKWCSCTWSLLNVLNPRFPPNQKRIKATIQLLFLRELRNAYTNFVTLFPHRYRLRAVHAFRANECERKPWTYFIQRKRLSVDLMKLWLNTNKSRDLLYGDHQSVLIKFNQSTNNVHFSRACMETAQSVREDRLERMWDNLNTRSILLLW